MWYFTTGKVCRRLILMPVTAEIQSHIHKGTFCMSMFCSKEEKQI